MSAIESTNVARLVAAARQAALRLSRSSDIKYHNEHDAAAAAELQEALEPFERNHDDSPTQER